MSRRLSLANKCQLLFAGAALLILSGALIAPWFQLKGIVEESQLETSRQFAETWIFNGIKLDQAKDSPILFEVVMANQLENDHASDSFVDQAYRKFLDDPTAIEDFVAVDASSTTTYRYARALREKEWRGIQDPQFVDFSARALETALDDPLRAILIIERISLVAAAQISAMRWYIFGSGVVGVALTVLVFWLILTKLIFSPVRRLRDSAERVRRGDMTVRSSLQTGDELEELSSAFNQMLDEVNRGQQSLAKMNESLGLKVVELSKANVGLFESNRLKSEFLANVSHELRTPLNSIIGFAELLAEIARVDPNADPKRVRYISNINNSARSLLEMINDLLDLAKIEAGRMSVTVGIASVADLVEGLEQIMRPQAAAKQLKLKVSVPEGLPSVKTDAGKLQQILYNFLSNAIKFSPVGGEVEIRAEVSDVQHRPSIRLMVIDQGEGVPFDLQDTIFEKFRQVDASHTKSHGGTGLGLAICRELATILGATVGIVSEPGRGSTFFVEVPCEYQEGRRKPLLPLMPSSAASGQSLTHQPSK